jgi:short-subunit dehydrogenase
MTICPGRVNTKMIKDMGKWERMGVSNPSTRNLIDREKVANKIYDMLFN